MHSPLSHACPLKPLPPYSPFCPPQHGQHGLFVWNGCTLRIGIDHKSSRSPRSIEQRRIRRTLLAPKRPRRLRRKESRQDRTPHHRRRSRRCIRPLARDGLTSWWRSRRLVELNCDCKTDFVARSALFGHLVADVAHSAAFLAESGSGLGPDESYRHEHELEKKTYIHPVPRDRLLDASLLSTEGEGPNAGAWARNGTQGTVGDAIR